jgi:hypothetical protein
MLYLHCYRHRTKRHGHKRIRGEIRFQIRGIPEKKGIKQLVVSVIIESLCLEIVVTNLMRWPGVVVKCQTHSLRAGYG